MKNRNRFGYALSSGVIIAALSHVFYESGGEFLLVPGMAIKLFLNDPIVVTLLFGGEFYTLPLGNLFTYNVAFYTLVVFALLLLVAQIRTLRKRSFV